MPKSVRLNSNAPAPDNVTPFPTPSTTTPVDVTEAIRQRAYELYCARGFEDGHADEDWFIAESEIRGGGLKSA